MSINTVPERLNDFRVYLDGSSDLKGLADIKLPSLENLTETVKGAGIAGEYESPTIGHFKSMQLELNWRSVTDDFLSLIQQKSQLIDCRGAFQEYDAAVGQYKIRQVRILVKGPTAKNDIGKFDKGSTSDGSTSIEVLYLKIDIDGKNMVEIDKLNYKCVINGVDTLADIRNALGL
jgi:P2 family phage contractile tail tube protein